jgi:hypothetical protein
MAAPHRGGFLYVAASSHVRTVVSLRSRLREGRVSGDGRALAHKQMEFVMRSQHLRADRRNRESFRHSQSLRLQRL